MDSPEQLKGIRKTMAYLVIRSGQREVHRGELHDAVIIGRAPECDNLYLCNGSSGHGVMHSPALGQVLAEIIVHGQSRSLDVEALRPSRFAEGRPNRAPQIL